MKESFEDAGAVRELPDPAPAAGEVRVRVRAASVNPFDAVAAAGHLKAMMECRFPYVPGLDLSGTVDMVGAGVTAFVVDQSSIARKPASVDHVGASTTGLAAVTALTALEILSFNHACLSEREVRPSV